MLRSDPISSLPRIALPRIHSRGRLYVSNAKPSKHSFVTNPALEEKIKNNVDHCLVKTSLSCGTKKQGKVRDMYELDNMMVFITTDRQSAFDRHITQIPFKGQVLNMTSAWWFEKTRHIIPNALISVPDPSVSVMKRLEVVPIEFVVRGYMTGSTQTSLWTHYKNGSRNYCGNVLPEGMRKNERLANNIITPTTKGVVDKPITPEEIVDDQYMTQKEWDKLSQVSMDLFAFGQKEAAKRGLILVDTKYEFGKDKLGNLYLIDEIHTPDSSRYWIQDTYEQRMRMGLEPENVDKEFLRLWFADNCDPYSTVTLPDAPIELICELSRRYIYLYEKITGETFVPTTPDATGQTRMQQIKDSIVCCDEE